MASMDGSDQLNVVDDPKYKDVVAEHAKAIRDGWRKQLPTL